MKKCKLFFNFEKEEKWLQDMASNGWQLQSVLFTYTFKKTKPEAAVIRTDCHIFNSRSRYLDYLTLFEDCGWKHIAGYKSGGMQYFIRTRADASEDIFSDAASKAGRYKRAADMWLSLFITYFIFSTTLFLNSSVGMRWSYVMNPKSAFFTPDIWSRTGDSFWRAFLIESPFAFFRIFTPLILFICVVLFGVFTIAFLRQYRKYRNKWTEQNNAGNNSL
jgi:hypothetical protein